MVMWFANSVAVRVSRWWVMPVFSPAYSRAYLGFAGGCGV